MPYKREVGALSMTITQETAATSDQRQKASTDKTIRTAGPIMWNLQRTREENRCQLSINMNLP